MGKPQYHLSILVFVMLLVAKPTKAQDNFIGYFEPALEVSYDVNSKYSQSFAIENRNLIYRQRELEYQAKQIDLSHFSEFQWKPQWAVGLGLKYRFENTFDDTEENEFRLQEQLVYTPSESHLNISHQMRIEQRFYASETKHRFRYELSSTLPFDRNNPKSHYFVGDTESLLELGKTQKPEFEQRLSTGFGFKLTEQTILELGTQYRLGNYTQNLNHELFLLAGLEVQL